MHPECPQVMSTDSVDYKRNPQVFKELLYSVSRDISAGARKDDFPETFKKVVSQFIDEVLDKVIRQSIDDFWVDNDLDKRIKKLVKISDSVEDKTPAWRPTTGVVDMAPLRASVLKKKSKVLKEHIESDRDYIKQLEFVLGQMRLDAEEVSAGMIRGLSKKNNNFQS